MSEKLTGIEGSFCTHWSGWDDFGTCLMFFDPEMKPEYQALVPDNQKVTCLSIDFENSKVQFDYGDTGEYVSFDIYLGIVPPSA